MSYTVPAYNAVNIELVEGASYAPPAYNVVNIELEDEVVTVVPPWRMFLQG